MSTFSSRYGYKSSILLLETASKELRGRIFTVFYTREFDPYDTLPFSMQITGIEKMMMEMGLCYEYPSNELNKQANANKLQKYIMDAEWYIVFDFIERYLNISKKDTVKEMSKEFNRILEEEMSAYRIINKQLVPIVTEYELESLEKALNISYESARTHIKKAVEAFSNRNKPDYENTIKDSVSAVEAMLCIITNEKNTTLGEALKKLESKGIVLHTALKASMSKLYGYASDEGGIRHGSSEFVSESREDAQYILITCSALVNYLIEKLEKVKSSC